jgi:hypothetical protein
MFVTICGKALQSQAKRFAITAFLGKYPRSFVYDTKDTEPSDPTGGIRTSLSHRYGPAHTPMRKTTRKT